MEIVEVNDTVVFVRGTDVNWTILRDGASFTLVDTGYPGYAGAVRESIRDVGLDISGLEAIVITHAHVDHIGGVPALQMDRRVPVYVGEPEVPMAEGQRTEQASRLDVVKRLWQPRLAPWLARVMRAGVTDHVTVPGAIGVADGARLDIPGRPTVTLAPGHTSGSICLTSADAVMTGDALITGHAITGRRGPQLIPDFFHHDPPGARTALSLIAALEGSAILPGHGPLWRGTPAEAVRQAAAGR